MDARADTAPNRTPRSVLARLRALPARCRSALMAAAGFPPETTELFRGLRRIARLTRPREIYEARFALLSTLSRAWGFETYNTDCAWLEDPAFWTAWRKYPGWQGQRADRKFVVWTLARHASRLDGDTVECGVFEGASSHLICTALQHRGGHRHHVFDSFAGLSEPGPADAPISAQVPAWRAGDLAAPLETVRANLREFPGVVYHPGWIPDRFHEVADRRFSFVHIDVDLHQPTRDALEFFYPRLVRGGMLVCDDYGSLQCAGARRACDEFMATCPERTMIHLPTFQGLVVKA